ncbi:hypothetical protein ACWXWK_03130 [Pantoea ananatis]
MFESIVLNRSIDGPSITIGEIAEALLFYQNVHIVMDTSTLIGLIKKIGLHGVIKLISHPDVKTTYIEEFLGVYTENNNFEKEYMLLSAYISGGENSGELKNWKKRLEFRILREGFTKKEVENFIDRFKKNATLKKLTSNHFIEGGIISAANKDLHDEVYISSAARTIVESLLPGDIKSEEIIYRVLPENNKFRVSTNIDFNRINEFQNTKTSENENFTPANIAAGILSASCGLILAAHYGGDFYTSATESKIIQVKNSQILTRAKLNQKGLNSFYEIALDGCPNISAVLNSGNRTFEEFLELLTRAKKFKKWLKGKSPDQVLLSNYIDDITSKGWLSDGPGKALRYLTSTALGFAGPLTGIAASAFDTFFLDKMCGGWKPNQFISEKLRPFVDNE